MSNPYIGEIRMFGGNFAPAGWAFCDGSLMPISENDALFTLIGTTFGGDGQETFGLPDLRGRVPMHAGSAHIYGETGGTESVTITSNTTPIHNHGFLARNAVANTPNPGGNMFGLSSQVSMFYADNPSQVMAANSVTPIGGSQPHENMMPYLAISFIISLFGIFPHQ
ncbi:MAG TPA: tail fiber protein [Saprospiraceae bacterium]|nr:tail fiber protein [Saprospiraceae bacterium]